jgi:hypothetical protein
MMSERTTAHIYWSIYVKTSNLRKLKEAHLPPIELALEKMEFDWYITTEEENPGLFRLVTYQNFEIERVEELIVPLLRRAYKLTSTWTITGLDDLGSGRLRHVHGTCSKPPNSNRPPALESLVFEAERGRILPVTEDGGWQVVDAGPEPEELKPAQTRWPKQPS